MSRPVPIFDDGPRERGHKAAASFFIRVEQVGRVARAQRCEWTEPLFPLLLILEADGTLAEDARHLLDRKKAC